jgi:sodium-dependent phosphate cotransporter
MIEKTASKAEFNEWNVDFSDDQAVPWDSLTTQQKFRAATTGAFKVLLIFGFLYLFVCSLSFLADGFRLVAGKDAGEVFRNSDLFNNPVAALMVGVLATVLVQSSSTSTSIVITMVASDLLTTKQAIPIIMGANIGTSVTSTIVAMGQISNKSEFRRAFAAATVHDMFNFMCVIVLLPLEMATGFLYTLSKDIVESIFGSNPETQEKQEDLLKRITKPFTATIVQVDKKLITKIAVETNQTKLDQYYEQSLLKRTPTDDENSKDYLFDPDDTGMGDAQTGACVLVLALGLMCVSLAVIVGLLKSLLKGRVAVMIHKVVNEDIEDRVVGGVTVPLKWVAGYLAMAAGTGITILVQSSSITTSALTPLVGVGVVNLERMYPLVLGANIGTTVTGILSALSQDGSKIAPALQVAFSHLFFNITGIFLFYVIWPMRKFPIAGAKFLGNTTAEYRWFAMAYIFVAFLIIPGVLVGLSIAGLAAFLVFLIPSVFVALFVAVVNFLQGNHKEKLPETLQTWEFLPLCLRSLEPLDRVFCHNTLTEGCCGQKHVDEASDAASIEIEMGAGAGAGPITEHSEQHTTATL